MNEAVDLRQAAATKLSGPHLRGPSDPTLLRDEVLAEVFAATVATRGHHPAMRDGTRTLSYAEVWNHASQMARGLMARGAAPGKVVGLWMPRGIDLLVAQIAITLTGAAWLP